MTVHSYGKDLIPLRGMLLSVGCNTCEPLLYLLYILLCYRYQTKPVSSYLQSNLCLLLLFHEDIFTVDSSQFWISCAIKIFQWYLFMFYQKQHQLFLEKVGYINILTSIFYIQFDNFILSLPKIQLQSATKGELNIEYT